MQHPVVLKIKMDGACIERINGAAGAAMGFTISPGPTAARCPAAPELARKDKRLASVNVVNTSHGAEVTVQFKDGVPPYLAKVKGDRLEIAIGREGHSKVAKSKKGKKKKKSDLIASPPSPSPLPYLFLLFPLLVPGRSVRSMRASGRVASRLRTHERRRIGDERRRIRDERSRAIAFERTPIALEVYPIAFARTPVVFARTLIASERCRIAS